MKVDFNNSTDPISRQIQPEPPAPVSTGVGGSTPGPVRGGGAVDKSNVSVSLSSPSAAYTAAVRSLPDVRMERVQALRQQVQSGAYTVDDHQLGEAMANDLFGAAYAIGK